jgi:tryptophan 7-halogenase
MPIEKIVIAGGGLAGWMAASALARAFAHFAVRISVVEEGAEDASLGPFVPALATLPATRQFHAQLDYAEDELIKAAAGCFTLGTAISGSGPSAFLAYGETGAPLDNVAFHDLARRLRGEGIATNAANYSLAALCAQTSRFMRPPPNCRTVLSTLDYGLMLASEPYADCFRRDAIARGVAKHNGGIAAVSVGDDGAVEAVSTTLGENISGDFFIDCSGANASIVGAIDPHGFESWQHFLPCDRLASGIVQSHDPPAPYAHMTAADRGWVRHIPLRGAINESCISSDDSPGAEHFIPGRRSRAWQKNVVAIGGAAAVVEPGSPLPLFLLQSAIRRLITLFPNDPRSAFEAGEYNRQAVDELDCALDWATLPYKINAQNGSPFWDQCRDMQVPERLMYRMTVYKATGRIVLCEGEIFESSDWLALFNANGLYPAATDPAADRFALKEIEDHFSRIRTIMLQEVAKIPFHAHYLHELFG